MITLKQEVERKVQAYRTKLLREGERRAKRLDGIMLRLMTKYGGGPVPMVVIASMMAMKLNATPETYVETYQHIMNHLHRSKLVRITAGFNGGVRLR